MGITMTTKKKAKKTAKKTRKKPGRTGVYDPKCTPSMIFALASVGKTHIEIARIMKISEKTFYKWQRDHEAISQVLEEAAGGANREVESAMLKAALGYESNTETVRGKVIDNKFVPIDVEKKKHMQPPNVSAGKFWLTNRCKHRWVDKTEVTGTMKHEHTHDMDLKKLSRSELERLENIIEKGTVEEDTD